MTVYGRSPWSVIDGIYRAFRWRATQYRLSTVTFISLFLLTIATLSIVVFLISASVNRVRNTRGEFFERDLKELVGRFDTDERFVLNNNITAFLAETRPLEPLLLPRSYYSALPPVSSQTPTPRQPPRNCFIELQWDSNQHGIQQEPDRLCTYLFTAPPSESYLYVAMSFSDNDITVLRTGDSNLNADAVVMTINYQNQKGIWWLTFQRPRNSIQPDRFEITAFQELSDRRRVRDKRFEGWAYAQKQSSGEQTVNVIARLDLKALDPSLKSGLAWPPAEWQNIHAAVARQNVSKDPAPLKLMRYASSGKTFLSIPSLATPIFNAYASLSVIEGPIASPLNEWQITPSSGNPQNHSAGHLIRFIDGDLIINQAQLEKTLSLPDTAIVFKVKHPSTVVEKAVWLTGVLFLFPLIGFILLTVYLVTQLLVPIFIISRESNRFMIRNDYSAKLPFSEKHNEVGILAAGLNRLLTETANNAQREQEEKERQAEETRRNESERIKQRERTLKTIGHEIRSPLQALLSLNGPESQSRRYLERILAAIKFLFSDAGPESTFDNRPISIEELDLVVFLNVIATNAPLANIPNVRFESIEASCFCNADSTVLEDAITHILTNANRYRPDGTTIDISLSVDSKHLYIDISNQGPSIPEEMLEEIFDLHFSTEKDDPLNQGIGLFAARNYISRMSGTIIALNKQPGVTFRIQLPMPNL